jgi:hypothetical protein
LRCVVVDAVVRNLEIIGEAASRVPEEFKVVHPGRYRGAGLSDFATDEPREDHRDGEYATLRMEY